MLLTGALIELEERISALLREVQELKMRAYALEEENEELRAFCLAADAPREGLEHLGRLYGEGFHICPPHFARSREGEDCLFCLAFLERGMTGGQRQP